MSDSSTVRLAHILSDCTTLGPGRRVVVWVAGCTRRCPGCIAEPIIGPDAGSDMSVAEVVERLLPLWPFDGLTFSGGEPFEQAAALCAVIDQIRAKHDVSVMAYSGFRLKELASAADVTKRDLLTRLDILVDGPFIATRQGSFLWRGSANQTVHLLSGRHDDLIGMIDAPSVGLEVRLDRENRLFWAGIPPMGFADALANGLSLRGIELDPTSGILA